MQHTQEDKELKCTEGNWKVALNGESVWVNNENTICNLGTHLPEYKANAYMLAASKDMYRAIEKMLKEFENPDNHAHQRSAVEQAKEALAKASPSTNQK